MHIGYIRAKHNDYKTARSVFIRASTEYKGAGARNPDYGTFPEQAEYQAAVCLMAEKKNKDAEKAFRSFIHKRPESPLVAACYRRLVMLNGNKHTKELDDLYQNALTKQQNWAQRELAMCGPRAIAHLAEKVLHKKVDIEKLAQICGTTAQGTTVDGIKRGLVSCGLRGYGFQVNREDFNTLEAPVLWLQDNHYYVIESIALGGVRVFDPMYNAICDKKLPAMDDNQFSAIIISLSPKVGSNS